MESSGYQGFKLLIQSEPFKQVSGNEQRVLLNDAFIKYPPDRMEARDGSVYFYWDCGSCVRLTNRVVDEIMCAVVAEASSSFKQ